MPEQLYIGIIGSAVCGSKTAQLAKKIGYLLGCENAVVVCGGYSGVMEAASKGVVEAGGQVIGILSGKDRIGANPYLSASIVTGMGEARNTVIVRSSHALIAISGGYGTLSEIGLGLKMERPVIGLGTWNIDQGDGKKHIIPANSAEIAVKKALEQGREKLNNNEID